MTSKAPYSVICVLALLLPAARAHAPHDIVEIIKVSPDFSSDHTVFAAIQLSDQQLLARSTDGGRSFLEYASPVLSHELKSMAISPNYANDGTLFAATNGGLWRSMDSGLHWEAVNTGLPTLKTNAVAISPGFVLDRTVLAATASGLFRSTDGGDTWMQVTAGLQDLTITAVVFDPRDSSTAYAGGDSLHRSSDGGLTWLHLEKFDYDLRVIAVSASSPEDPSMAAIFRKPHGILRSMDRGVTWQPATEGLTDFEVNDLTFTNDGTVFAVTSTEGCFRADSILSPWSPFNEGFEELSDQSDIHFRTVAPSPDFSLDETVFVGAFEGFFKSTDRGALWKQSDLYNQRLCRRIAPSPDFAHDGQLFVGNFGGGPFLWTQVKTGAPHGGGMGGMAGPAGSIPMQPGGSPSGGWPNGTPLDWEALGDETASLYTSVFTVSPDFASDRTLFYAYFGLWRSMDGGETWARQTIPIDIPREIAFSPQFALDSTLYMGTGKVGAYLSRDRGDSWEELMGGLPYDLRTTHIRLAPDFASHPTLFFASGNHGVWRSTDGGDTWVEASFGMESEEVRAFDLSPDFMNDGLLLAGTGGKGLYRSDNQGDAWVPLNHDFPSGPENVIVSISFSPAFASDRTVFVVSSYDGVYKSTDGGWSFEAAKSGLPLDHPRAIALSPAYASDQTVFLSTHAWIWRSRDGGSSWHRLPGYNRVDDRHPAACCQGEWEFKSLKGAFAAFVTRSREAEAIQELQFFGDSITCHAVRDAESGVAEIVLDHQVVAVEDLYSPSTQLKQPLFKKTFPHVRWHTIQIRVTGIKNPEASDAWIKSDGFEFTF